MNDNDLQVLEALADRPVLAGLVRAVIRERDEAQQVNRAMADRLHLAGVAHGRTRTKLAALTGHVEGLFTDDNGHGEPALFVRRGKRPVQILREVDCPAPVWALIVAALDGSGVAE